MLISLKIDLLDDDDDAEDDEDPLAPFVAFRLTGIMAGLLWLLLIGVVVKLVRWSLVGGDVVSVGVVELRFTGVLVVVVDVGTAVAGHSRFFLKTGDDSAAASCMGENFLANGEPAPLLMADAEEEEEVFVTGALLTPTTFCGGM